MPVLQVFASDLDDVQGSLESLCREVADALDLEPSDVVATYVRVESCVVPGDPDARWPVVIMHGSKRASDRMSEARERVAAMVGAWTGVSGVWVTWQVSE